MNETDAQLERRLERECLDDYLGKFVHPAAVDNPDCSVIYVEVVFEVQRPHDAYAIDQYGGFYEVVVPNVYDSNEPEDHPVDLAYALTDLKLSERGAVFTICDYRSDR
jgi:hypothetical protein